MKYQEILITRREQDDPQYASTTTQYQDDAKRMVTWSLDKGRDFERLEILPNRSTDIIGYAMFNVAHVVKNRMYERGIAIEREHLKHLIEYLSSLYYQGTETAKFSIHQHAIELYKAAFEVIKTQLTGPNSEEAKTALEVMNNILLDISLNKWKNYCFA